MSNSNYKVETIYNEKEHNDTAETPVETATVEISTSTQLQL